MNLPLLEESHQTHVGLRRAVNQDNMLVQLAQNEEQWQAKGSLFMVADGMGGHKGGEKASQLAIQQVPLVFGKMLEMGHDKALRRALLEANQEIHRRGKESADFYNMGTTATILLLNAKGAWVAHVGDSRVYRIREGIVEQLSYDHSYIWEVARIHNITPEEAARNGILSNKITRCLGPEPEVLVDLEGPHEILPGDIFLLCSDGLSNKVTEEEMGLACSHLDPHGAGEFLIDLANRRGGPDNITVVIAKVPGKSDEHPPLIKATMDQPSVIDRLFNWSWVLFLIAGAGAIGGALICSFSDQIIKSYGFYLMGLSLFVASALSFYFSEKKNRTLLDPIIPQAIGPRIHRRKSFSAHEELGKLILDLESLLMGLGRQKFAVDPSWAQRIEESRALWKEQKVVDSLNKARQMLHGTIEMIQKSTKQSQLFN
jgi:protein phosphatase